MRRFIHLFITRCQQGDELSGVFGMYSVGQQQVIRSSGWQTEGKWALYKDLLLKWVFKKQDVAQDRQRRWARNCMYHAICLYLQHITNRCTHISYKIVSKRTHTCFDTSVHHLRGVLLLHHSYKPVKIVHQCIIYCLILYYCKTICNINCILITS